jgi:hypothetical protein
MPPNAVAMEVELFGERVERDASRTKALDPGPLWMLANGATGRRR